MNVDLLITIVVLAMAMKGYKKRTFPELLGLFGYVAALVGATVALPYVASVLEDVLDQTSYAIAAALLLVFVLGLVILRFPGKFTRKHVKMEVTEGADRFIGLAIGLYKGAVWGGLLTIFFMLVPIRGPVDLNVDESNFARQSKKAVPLTIEVARKFVPNMGDFVSYVEAAYVKTDSTQGDSLVDALIVSLKNIEINLDSLNVKTNLENVKTKLDSLGVVTDE